MSLLFAVLAAVAPGLYAWSSGRTLIAALGDPTFPDLHFARSRTLGYVTLAGIVIASALAGVQLWWTIPLTLLALLAGSWPARRALFGETWTFGQYLRYSIASVVGMAGFWILLVWAPILISDLGSVDVRVGAGAAAVLAILLLGINVDFPRFWLALHGATPLARPELDERFEAILERATCARPSVHRFGVSGGHIMNAFALPAAKAPAVAFGDSLLASMTPDEVAAVFAHEVAHLEHFSPPRLRRLALATTTLVLLSTALPAGLAAVAPQHDVWLSLALIIAVMLLFLRIVGKGQANETASDLRAAELTGNPETLIVALTKLHLHMRLPRHWPHEIEPTVSHPSLARRIQAIRQHVSDAGHALADPVVVRASHGAARIALDDARAYWFDGVPPGASDDIAVLREQASGYRALAYAELCELRLTSAGGGRALRARDLSGQAWAVTIHPDDVVRLQSALEVVDTRLGRRRKHASFEYARLIAAALFLAILAAGDIGILLVPLALAAFRPGTAAVAALGAMAVARASAMAVGGELTGATITGLGGVTAIAILGATALWLAWRSARPARHGGRSIDDRSERAAASSGGPAVAGHGPTESTSPFAARPTFLILGVTAGILLLLLVGSVRSGVDLTLTGPTGVSLAVTMLGLAAAIGTVDRPRWRRTALALSVTSVVAVLALARSSARALGAPLPVVEVLANRTGEIFVPRSGYRLELSPGGQRWAVQSVMSEGAAYTDEEDVAFRWTLGRVDAAAGSGRAPIPASDAGNASTGTRELEAIDLAFIDDERVITLGWRDDSLELRLETADPGTVEAMTHESPDHTRMRSVPRSSTRGPSEWSRRLPALYSPVMFVDAAGGRWTVAGRRDDGALVAMTGTIAAEWQIQHVWPRDSMWVQPLHIGEDGAALVYTVSGPAGTFAVMLAMLGRAVLQVDLWRIEGDRRQRVAIMDGMPICRAADNGALCVGRNVDRTRLWAVAATGELSPLGVLPDGYDVRHLGRSGGVAAIARDGTGPLLIDATLGSVRRVRLRGGDATLQARTAVDAQASGSVLAILELGSGGATIGIYSVGDRLASR